MLAQLRDRLPRELRVHVVVELVQGVAGETRRFRQVLPRRWARGGVVDACAFWGREGAEVDHADYAAGFSGLLAGGFGEVFGCFAAGYAAGAVHDYYYVVAYE